MCSILYDIKLWAKLTYVKRKAKNKTNIYRKYIGYYLSI